MRIILFILISCITLWANVPYSELLDIQTKRLHCVFKNSFNITNPIETLENLELTNKVNIEKLFEKDNKNLDIYKAFVLDYYYKSTQAEEFYRRASGISKENKYHYIYYLSRTNKYEEAIRLLTRLNILSTSMKKIKLISFIYLIHNKNIKNHIISKLERKKVYIEDLKRELNECKQ